MKQKLTQEYLNELFEYKEGDLYWRVKRRKTKPGDKAGRRKSNGYCEVGVDGVLHGTHRLIFMMFHGYMPRIVDHADGNPSNNKIENLREASHMQNMWNSKTPNTNTSGFKGVYFNKKTKKWVAQCFYNNKHIHLGSYSDIHDAAEAVKNYREAHQGVFANHG